MPFDVDGALGEGYTLPEIAAHLAASKKFDLSSARKEGYSDEEIIGHLTKVPKPPTPGFISAVKSGFQSLKGDVGAIGAATGVEGAEQYAAEQRKKAAEQYQLPEFTDKPWEYVKGLAGQSIPYMVAPVVAGLAAPEAIGALGATALAGAVSAGQFTGSNVSRQLGEGTSGKDVNLLGAVAAAVPQAALDILSLKMIPGIGRIFGQAGIKVSEKEVQEAVKRGLLGTVADKVAQYGPVALKTAGTEGLTEAGQQVLERLQAGLNITDKEARDEYFQSFLGGAVLGGAIAVPGHALDRATSRAKQEAQPTASTPTPAPTPAPTSALASTGLPDTYAAAVQESEFLKQQPQTEETKTRLAKLEAYKERLISDDITATKRQPLNEPTSLNDQIQNQSVTQGEFRGMMDLPTQEAVAEIPEAPAKEMPAALDERTLDGTGLPKQSGLYKQLIDKDLTNLVDLDAVMQIVERAKTNRTLSAETKNALESIATRAFAIYGQQDEMFSPKGAVLEAPVAIPTAATKKIDEVIAGKDLSNPEDLAVIRDKLTDYANGATRSMKAIQTISDYLDSLPAESTAPVAEEVVTAPVEAPPAPVEAPPAEQAAAFIKKSKAPPEQTTLQQRSAFAKGISAVNPYRGHFLQGRKNNKAANAVRSGDTAGAIAALEGSKNPLISWVASQARNVKGLNVGIDDAAIEEFDKSGGLSQQNAAIQIGALDALRTARARVESFVPTAYDKLPSLRGIFVLEEGNEFNSGNSFSLQDYLRATGVIDKPGFFNELEEMETLIGGQEIAWRNAAEGKFKALGIAGAFNPKTNTVTTTDYHANDETVLGHELMHAVTLSALQNPTSAQRSTVNKIRQLYAFAKSAEVKDAYGQPKLLSESYGTYSMEEFVAEGLSNPDFQQKLNQIPYKNETVWGKFTSSIAELLGVKKDSAFMELIALTEELQSTKPTAPVTKAPRKVKYREAGVGTKGMTQDRVSKVVDFMSDKWVNAPKINIVQSITDLPQFLQDQIKKDKVNPKGAFDPDSKEVFLIADNITGDVDVAMTLAHEALGHFGLRSLLGAKFSGIMNTIYAGNNAVRLRADEKISPTVDKETAVEEVLAEMAEEVANPDAKKDAHKLNALQRVVNAIRQFFAGLGFPLKNVTDGEIRGLIVNARQEVRLQKGQIGAGRLAQKGEGVAAAGKPLYKTAPLTPEGEAAAALNERMKGISNPREDGGDATAKSMLGINHFFTRKDAPGLMTRLRRHIADKDATVIEKLQAEFDNKLVDSLGNARGDLLADQAQDTAGFTDNVLDKGGIGIGADGLVNTFEAKHGASMKKVFSQLKTFGDKLGSLDLAMQVAHNALIANRANEINKFNAIKRQEIAAAEAKGNKKAVELLEKQIITIKASQAETDAGLDAMKQYPEIKEVLDTFTAYKNGLIDFMVECGRINDETARNWKDNAGYVPWTRIEEEVDAFDTDTSGAYKSGLINLSKLPKLDKEGSSKEIANVFDNMIGFTSWAIKSGLKNRAATAMAEQLPDAVEIKTDDQLKLEQKRNKDRVIYTYKKGERTAYLLGSALDMSAFSTNIEVLGPVMQGFKFIGDTLRGAITHMPAFALSQLIQDGVYRGMLLSGVERPFSLPAKVFANFAKALRGDLGHIQALGITGVYDGIPDHAMQRAKLKYGIKEQNAAMNAWGKLEKFSMAADLAVRAAIYEQTIEETKTAERPDGDTRLALYRAKEYINFKRSGASPTIRTLRHIVPFMNAYIQGMDVLVRTMRGKGVSLQEKRKAQQLFLATGLKLAALSAAYTMLVGGDDDYEGLEEYERDKNYIIPGTGIKIPVAPEVGFLFKVIPERIIRYVVSQGTERPQDAETFYRGFRDAFVNAYGGPSVMPQAVKPALEVMVNYSFFTGNPIVGQSMKNVDPSNQFTSGTSELAKLFGAVGISPLKVDYLIRGYTGMVGAITLDVTDAVANPDRMSKPINKLPQISTFMYDSSGRGYKSEFYSFRESVDQVVDTVSLFKREGRAEELQKYLTPEKLQLYAMRGVTGKIEDTLGKLRAYRNVIANDPDVSSAEKRELTDGIQAQEKEILLAYNLPKLREMSKPQD